MNGPSVQHASSTSRHLKRTKPSSRFAWAVLSTAVLSVLLPGLATDLIAQTDGLTGPMPVTDSHQILVGGEVTGQSDLAGIRVIRSDGTDPLPLTNYAFNDDFPSWTPDGAQIVFGRRLGTDDTSREIMIMNSDASNLQQLTRNSYVDSQPHVSPDGKTIAFHRTVVSKKRGVTTSRDDIYVMGINGKKTTGVTTSLPSSLQYSDPRWSPDGSRIVFVARADNGIDDNLGSVWSTRSDGTDLIEHTDSLQTGAGTDSDPAYNSAGTEIVFARLPRDFIRQIVTGTYSTDWQIVRKNLTTGVETVLATGEGFTCPIWARDDISVLFLGNFISEEDDLLHREILEVDSGGGSWFAITNETYNPNSPFVPTYLEMRN